ncbi:bifunctional DNA-formamidopyrimidine glycosylase/DNA-(apurinic or apyrimidinic site) lyase [Hydrogenovibrio sp. 3SP14C1]|uniref:bifunctional DNA-formamidopyrimidine glycosylase/DNA-(apurinic or apyrimidinic site) lyase n=1 Tax=Hydrogenovibrio sp. 3SP14C1 TaxID=3038774 RepID=UPI002417C5FA|nr:bifunctional DNA-formamidopyrimidine glycosylase/DNA-(apurinic or apyrimidinic site) lyase [Hydrogenovibrio sp. 3SP14C1]MDG4812583.1 bifunctional DNA-formamidopyrimidine glycosylase/DNA-(apurinic or apyrimidinic site) lyase [Hydrogenovibrio sp. 3SP14C1]
MPELPEVETTRKGIQPKVEGQTIQKIIIRNGKLRWPVEQNLVKKLPGLVILSVRRRAKYLLLETTQGHLIIHLGMSGNLRVLPQQEPAIKHDHIDLILGNGFLLRYHDPRRFGSWLWTDKPLQEHPLLKALGPEPLTDDFNADYLFQKLQGRKTAIKTFIMNNHIVVGVGNIYANESLFLSGIHPTRPAHSLTIKETTQLTGHIKTVLSAAIEQGGTTLKDFLTPDGKPGYFEQKLNVYGKEGLPCPLCDSAIEKIVLNQRAAYFCSNCQK